jgi:hypothetical protein
MVPVDHPNRLANISKHGSTKSLHDLDSFAFNFKTRVGAALSTQTNSPIKQNYYYDNYQRTKTIAQEMKFKQPGCQDDDAIEQLQLT